MLWLFGLAVLGVEGARHRKREDLECAGDEELMELYSQGDVRAFEVLRGRHQGAMLRFLNRALGGNSTKAEDLLQDLFMRVVSSAGGYRRSAKFTTWLYTIARNLVIDESRKAKHRRTVSLDAPVRAGRSGQEGGGGTEALLGSTIAGASPNGEAMAMDGQFRQRLKEALESLPEEQRMVFLLREGQGLPFKEIGQVMGCSENTTKSRMRYALEVLRSAMTDLAEPFMVSGAGGGAGRRDP